MFVGVLVCVLFVMSQHSRTEVVAKDTYGVTANTKSDATSRLEQKYSPTMETSVFAVVSPSSVSLPLTTSTTMDTYIESWVGTQHEYTYGQTRTAVPTPYDCCVSTATAVEPPTVVSVPMSNKYTVGVAKYYMMGLLGKVAQRRGTDLDGASGFSTYPNCREIGRVLYVSVLDPRTERWSGWHAKRIVDCSQTVDYARHVREGLVELSYDDAVRYGYAGEGKTRIRFRLATEKAK